MPSDTFKRAARRFLDRNGTTATLTNYTEKTDASGNVVYDGHGDPERTQDSQTAGVPALFRRPSRVNTKKEQSFAGLDSSIDVLVWLPDDASEPIRQPDENNTYPTRITDEASGRDYDVVTTWPEDNGQIRAACKEV